MSSLQFKSYIAHSLKQPKELLNLQEELTNRGFPCIQSSDFEDTVTAPKELSWCREKSISDPLNRFFIFFIELSQHDPVALVELGMALNNKTEFICAIGHVRPNSFFYNEKVIQYSDVDNFLSRHFFS